MTKIKAIKKLNKLKTTFITKYNFKNHSISPILTKKSLSLWSQTKKLLYQNTQH